MWDSMGDLGFTKSFGMLPTRGKLGQNKENKQDKYMRITVASQVGVAVFGHVPYMIAILDLIPFLNREYKEFVTWCEQLVVERKQVCQRCYIDPGRNFSSAKKKRKRDLTHMVEGPGSKRYILMYFGGRRHQPRYRYSGPGY